METAASDEEAAVMVELSGRTSRSSNDPISSSPTVGIEVLSSVIEALRR